MCRTTIGIWAACFAWADFTKVFGQIWGLESGWLVVFATYLPQHLRRSGCRSNVWRAGRD
jgi:hypothetical protein